MTDNELKALWDSEEQALTLTCGAVYPDSVLQGYQSGEVHELDRCRVVWHSCGFAFLYGIPAERDLTEITFLMRRAPDTGRRFVLFVENEKLGRYFELNTGVTVSKRYFYTFKESKPGEMPLPEGFEIKALDPYNIPRLDGRITPSFSWESTGQFLKNGKGFCVMCGDTPASWAFSAAVSDTEIDIGVETAERFRGKGLAAAAANEMIKYVLSVGKKPVWACHSGNIASQKTAEKIGFIRTGECRTVILQA